jgi:hypothetical protein
MFTAVSIGLIALAGVAYFEMPGCSATEMLHMFLPRLMRPCGFGMPGVSNSKAVFFCSYDVEDLRYDTLVIAPTDSLAQ